jgi:hydrogenase maturation protease
MTVPRLLVAGIGNIFLGDDAFGVEVARRLAGRPLPAGVEVRDFGIRGFDLACALVDGHAGAILVDTAQQGGEPGTLYVIEPELPAGEVPPGVVEGHGLHPAKVLLLARQMGEVCPWVRIVACEPLTFGSEEEPVMGLSDPVAAAVDEAVRLVESLAGKVLDGVA